MSQGGPRMHMAANTMSMFPMRNWQPQLQDPQGQFRPIIYIILINAPGPGFQISNIMQDRRDRGLWLQKPAWREIW